MTRERNYIKYIKLFSNNYALFSNGAKGKIIKKGKLAYLNLPFFYNVLLVYGLIANLISIIKLCAPDLCVKFDNMKCTIIDKQHIQLMKGFRSLDNYYIWSHFEKNQP